MPIPYVFDPETHIVRDLKGNWIPTTTQIQAAMHLSFDFKRFVEPDILDRTGRVGSQVHALTDIYDKYNDLDPSFLTSETHGYVESYIGFRRISGFKPKEWSVRYCENIGGYPVSGELDKDGTLNGHPCIADLKTGAKSDAHGIQLANYEQLKFASTRIGRVIRAVIHLHEDGRPGTIQEYGECSPVDGTHYGETFLAALHCFHWAMKRKFIDENYFLNNAK